MAGRVNGLSHSGFSGLTGDAPAPTIHALPAVREPWFRLPIVPGSLVKQFTLSGEFVPDRRYSQLRQLGLLASIPALMVVAPLLGLFAGQWLERKFHFDPWGTIVGLVLGFGAAVREIRDILRRVKDEDSRRDDGDDREP